MGQWSACPAEPKVPVVSLMSTVYPFPADHVGYNRRSVGRLIAEHLHRQGITDAAYVGPDDRDRGSSFRDTFRKLNRKAKVQSHLVEAPYRIVEGLQVIDRTALRRTADKMNAQPPEAVFCHSDDMTAELRSICLEKSSRWANTLWAGCNNDPQWRQLLGHRSVTVEICAAEIGRLAVRRAVEIARHPGQSKQTLLVEPYLVSISDSQEGQTI
jgi:DNA-binding LacI/PurR family transcriptional regulator